MTRFSCHCSRVDCTPSDLGTGEPSHRKIRLPNGERTGGDVVPVHFLHYSTFFGRIKALWGANPPFRGHNPAIFANRLTLFDGPGPKSLAEYRSRAFSRRFPRSERRTF